jgi:hypothetical protein
VNSITLSNRRPICGSDVFDWASAVKSYLDKRRLIVRGVAVDQLLLTKRFAKWRRGK